MRDIDVSMIKDAVAELCLKANFDLRRDVLSALKTALKKETNVRARKILKDILENAKIAKKKRIAICQDTGIVSVFLEIGQDVAITGGNLREAIDAGVAEAYRKGYLRKSVVDDPLLRRNTNTNTPSVISVDITRGDRVHIAVSPKGFGSENKSAVRMFRPTASIAEIKDFVLDVVKAAGPDACPPFVVGIGLGGTFDKAAQLSKRALLLPVDGKNSARHIASLEKELLKEINLTGIGPMGLGGKTTCLGLRMLEFPTHIAGLPVAVNISCHATRSAEKTL
jgi:fumarate hydratase subunit alpha